MKPHKCVEWGGCKAADCDGSLPEPPISKSQQKRLAIQKGNPLDLYAKATEAQKELREWQLLIIQAVSAGLTLDEDTVRYYRQAVTANNRYTRLIAKDMCK